MERIFCIYCKQTIEVGPNDEQICPNCVKELQIPHAELFNGVFVLENEFKILNLLQDILKDKIVFKHLNKLTANEFDINEDHSVTYLKINCNHIEILPGYLSLLTNLQELKIISRSLYHIADNFKPPKLRELSLFSCKFKIFPPAIFECSELTNLWISGSEIKEIPDEIANLRKLLSLKLNNNRIQTITENITDLHDLSILDLGCNQLRKLPTVLFELENLTILKLHVNYLEKIPRALIKLINLQILEIYCNHLLSLPPLPSSIEYLDISSNFQLELSEDFVEFENLKSLNIAGNNKIDKEILRKKVHESALITKLNSLEQPVFFLK